MMHFSQYILYSLILSPLCRVINREQHESISTIDPAIMENTECTIVKALSGCVTLTLCIIMLHFASSSSNVWLTFPAKTNVRSVPACSVLTK